MADLDWLEDDSMSADETMRRFEALAPVATVGAIFGEVQSIEPRDDGSIQLNWA